MKGEEPKRMVNITFDHDYMIKILLDTACMHVHTALIFMIVIL